MAKKGAGKGKGKGKNKLEDARLQQLLACEAEAEEFQRQANEKRERDAQDERMSLLREEQLRLIRQKEKRIEELNQRFEEVSMTLDADRISYSSQIETLAVLRESLLNEVSLLKAENDERHRIFTQERQGYITQIEQLRSEVDRQRENFEEEKLKLREEIHRQVVLLEEERQAKDTAQEQKEEGDRTSALKIRTLERELERALTVNSAMQQAVENREADDKKNICLMQMLNAQLEESKRHFEEMLEEERMRMSRVKEELVRSETQCAHLQEEIQVVKTEWSEAKMASDVEVREYQRQLEQVKFDTEYLNKELMTLRGQAEESLQKAEIARDEAQNDLRNAGVEVEGLQKKIENLEALLYRKEREHFDKVTFLNAQISNNRTVIAQMQEKIARERQSHAAEAERHTMDMKQTIEELSQLNTAEKEQAKLRAENEEKLLEDIATLKATVFQLQSALEEKEKANGRILEFKEEEIGRLRNILDANFIPHRKDVAASQASSASDEVYMLRTKTEELQREIAIREQASVETETWLKARLTNQGQVIEQLQNDLKKLELQRLDEINCLETEISRLKKTLEINFIPVPM